MKITWLPSFAESDSGMANVDDGSVGTLGRRPPAPGCFNNDFFGLLADTEEEEADKMFGSSIEGRRVDLGPN